MKNVVFKKVKLTGATREEALAKSPISVLGDATQALTLWQKENKGGDLTEFCKEYLEKKKMHKAANVGYVITFNKAVVDTRKRPWVFNDVKNEKGKRKYATFYEAWEVGTGRLLAETQGTKSDAKEMCRDLYRNGFKGDITCSLVKKVVEGEPIAFRVEYAPSANTQEGEYLVFGMVDENFTETV